MIDPNRRPIDRSRDDLPNDTTPWRLLWIGLVLLWSWTLVNATIDWNSVALGGVTGALLAAWALMNAGGKMPGQRRRDGGERKGES